MKTKKIIFFLFVLLSYFPVLAQVDTAWVRRFDGPGNSMDLPKALAVDSLGNVYVAGFCTSNRGDWDLVTIKYSSKGELLWTQYYNGPDNRWDEANALTLDENGYVYVTGMSEDKENSFDFITIKYSQDGENLWTRRFNGSEDLWDEARAIALDRDGNVCVTGSINGSAMNKCATIKYSPKGDTIWVRYSNLKAVALAIDSIGDVIVTGDNFKDCVTAKYSSDGDELWINTYGLKTEYYWNAGYAIAVDHAGNAFVTGKSEDSSYVSYRLTISCDYLTIKYAPNGDTLWVRRYSGPDKLWDNAEGLMLDKDGNLYVVGSIWTETGFDFATIKYNQNGDTLWTRHYNRWGAGNDNVEALAVDDIGNVYVTGYSDLNNINSDFTTIKYSPEGKKLWLKNYDGPANRHDHAKAIIVDKEQNIYVVGSSYGQGTDSDFCLIKYVQGQKRVRK